MGLAFVPEQGVGNRPRKAKQDGRGEQGERKQEGDEGPQQLAAILFGHHLAGITGQIESPHQSLRQSQGRQQREGHGQLVEHVHGAEFSGAEVAGIQGDEQEGQTALQQVGGHVQGRMAEETADAAHAAVPRNRRAYSPAMRSQR